MKNQDNDKTAVRTQRTPLGAPHNAAEHGNNVLPMGTRLGEFEIVDLIGEGGFGIVYLAYDHSLERHVALKEYMPSGLATRTTTMAVSVRSQANASTFTAGLKSFINEARLLAQFDSPALVKVHRFWESNGTAYMVMPFYDGITLKQALKERRIVPNENWIRLLLADLFDAIETIHRAQCFHRDIAPDNILLLKDGRPLLLDFGAARRVIGDLTQCLTVILKPGFAPIEQYADIAGLRQGAWTDIYALAAVVYYLIAGKAPPPAVARIVHDDMIPAREAGRGRYSSSFLAVLDKALAVKPEQRFQSIAELRYALDLMETVPRTPPRPSARRAAPDAPTVRMDNAQPGVTVPLGHADMEPSMKTRVQPPHQQEGVHRSHPRTAPGSQPHTHPRSHPQEQHVSEDYTTRTMYLPPDGESHERNKPAWLMMALLLLAGIAAGILWGTYRSSDRPPPATEIASTATAVPDSSGSSAEPEQETIEPPIAMAPAKPDTTEAPVISEAPPTQNAAPPSPPAVQESTPARVEPPVANGPDTTAPLASAPVTSKAAPDPDSDSVKPDVVKAAPAEKRPSPEEELWRAVSKSDRESAYERYLKAYPKGRYAAIARLRLEDKQSKAEQARLAAAAAQEKQQEKKAEQASSEKLVPPTASKGGLSSEEEALWDTATAINQPPAYEAYLQQYPRGRFAALAKDKLAGFKAAESAARKPAPDKPEAPKAPEALAQSPQPAADKLASIKPSEPARPSLTKPPATDTSPRAEQESPADAGRKTIKLDNQTMVGNFTVDPKTGAVSGSGKIVWSDGNRFEGTLVRGVKEGRGQFVWSNGQRYSGDWARDVPNGKGTIVFANGNRYTGDVSNGRPHGQGTIWFRDGDIYKGAWVNGKSHGHGRYTWANGSYWEGEFRDDQRTENGTMVFSESARRAAAGGRPAGPDQMRQIETAGTANSGR